MALTNDNPSPVIVKVFKKGQDKPVKDLKGKTEVLDVTDVIEDDDVGTYIYEFTNTSSYTQDMSFIIKQIDVVTDEDKKKEKDAFAKKNIRAPEE